MFYEVSKRETLKGKTKVPIPLLFPLSNPIKCFSLPFSIYLETLEQLDNLQLGYCYLSSGQFKSKNFPGKRVGLVIKRREA